MAFPVSFLIILCPLDYSVPYRVLLPFGPLKRIVGIFGGYGEECLASCRVIALCSFQVHRAWNILFMGMTISRQSRDNILDPSNLPLHQVRLLRRHSGSSSREKKIVQCWSKEALDAGWRRRKNNNEEAGILPSRPASCCSAVEKELCLSSARFTRLHRSSHTLVLSAWHPRGA